MTCMDKKYDTIVIQNKQRIQTAEHISYVKSHHYKLTYYTFSHVLIKITVAKAIQNRHTIQTTFDIK